MMVAITIMTVTTTMIMPKVITVLMVIMNP